MRQIFDDYGFKRAIQIGVFLVVFSCIISQIMMQMGGGERDQPMDLTDQLPDDVEQGGLVFEDGFPPFISSAGAFMPEKAVFDFGLFTGGVVMIFLSFEIYHRTKPEGNKRQIANVVSLISGTIIGFSMMQIVAHPFNTSIVMHIFWAMSIFLCAQIWIAALTYARGELDAEISWRGWPMHRIRWTIFAVAVISFQVMRLMVTTGHLVESAIFEWTLTFSAEAMMLSLIPTITSAASD